MLLASDRNGQGPPLVLVHGITSSRRSWDPLVPALASSHDVVAVDLRGHGESSVVPPFDPMTMAGDLHEVLESEDVSEPLLVGHSLGAMVATAYAAMYDARAVVNVDQPLRLGGFQDELRSIEPLLRGDEAAFQQAMSMVADSLRGQLPDAEWDRQLSLLKPNQQVVLGIWSVVLESPADELEGLVAAMVSAVKVPYLALHGRDPGPGYAVWLSELIPTSRVEVWDGLGHLPHLVDPGRFLDRLQAFETGLPQP